jgi:hypothetical protein
MKNKDNTKKDKRVHDAAEMAFSPLDEALSPQQRFERTLELSDLVAKMAIFIIGHSLVDYEERLKDERLSVASAYLQRVTSTHLCNHKLTKEGIEYRFGGEVFRLHEEFKTMTLTRSVYEHLAIFYFLYEHPKTDEERELAWNSWKANSKDKEEEWRVSYSQAWKYLFKSRDMAKLYHHLSMHCHPVYDGLLQYQNQGGRDEGYDGIPLYLSSCFLAYLCRLFLRQMPEVGKVFDESFPMEERRIFNALSQLSAAEARR